VLSSEEIPQMKTQISWSRKFSTIKNVCENGNVSLAQSNNSNYRAGGRRKLITPRNEEKVLFEGKNSSENEIIIFRHIQKIVWKIH
jgi:hypothetical protein